MELLVIWLAAWLVDRIVD